MSSDEQAQGEVPGSEPDAAVPAAHVVSDGSLPVHDLRAGVEAMRAAAAVVLEASRCAWSLSDGEAREVVEAFTRAMASAEAARLAVIKVLDERPEAVPGASEGKVAAAFLTGRLNVDQGGRTRTRAPRTPWTPTPGRCRRSVRPWLRVRSPGSTRTRVCGRWRGCRSGCGWCCWRTRQPVR